VDFTTDTVLLEHAVDELYTMGEFSSFGEHKYETLTPLFIQVIYTMSVGCSYTDVYFAVVN
jgi:hypothetical protein